ncbi:10330_t:CDS:2 [Funneliformis geosporum]|nr:10330_t:CDS:2 [Funneliformis geosporum]
MANKIDETLNNTLNNLGIDAPANEVVDNNLPKDQTGKLIDYNNIEEVERLVGHLNGIIKSKQLLAERNYNMFIKTHVDLATMREQYNEILSEKNKWHKEALRANKNYIERSALSDNVRPENSKDYMMRDVLNALQDLKPVNRRNFGQHDYNTRTNEFLPFLQNVAFQDEVHDVMISRAPLLEFFEKSGQVQQFGNKAIFYGTEPLPVFHQEVPIVIKKRYRSRSNYNEEKLAMEPRLLPQLLKQIVKDITTRASYELNTKVIQLLCRDTNFKNNGENEEKSFSYQVRNSDGSYDTKTERRNIISNLTKKPLEEFMKPEQV